MDLKVGVAAVGVAAAVGIAVVKVATGVPTDTVTCEYVRRVDGQVAGYVFYAGPSVKGMTGQAVLFDTGTPYEVGRSYSIADSKLAWTFGH